MRSFFSAASSSPVPKRVIKGKVTPMRSVPKTIRAPEYFKTGKPHQYPSDIRIYKEDEIPKLREAGRLARKILDFSLSLAKEGLTTEEIDILAHEEIIKHGAYPSPINYCAFPKAICTSINEVVCHGIPDSRPLVNGDILSIDVSVYLNGFHGDNCGTVVVGGTTDERGHQLIRTTYEALDAAIAKLGPGVCLTVVGDTIQKMANANKFDVVQEFVGHGTGEILHMLPYVQHHINNDKLQLRAGMVFTVEPILVEGRRKVVTWDDNWTIATADNSRGAQVEHEVLITNHGVEILTINN